MKRYILAIPVGLMVLFAGFIWQWPDGKLHVVACDVGQGDGLVIWQGFNQVVVDGGPNDSISDCLGRYLPFWDRQLELVVLTNGDADHVTGLIEILKRYEVKQLVANHLVKPTERFKAFRQAVTEEGVEVYGPKQGDKIEVGPSLRFEVLWPKERLGDKLVWMDQASEKVLGANSYDDNVANEQSIVMRLEYGEFSALLTGDVGSSTERLLLSARVDLASDVLKVGHHGSKYSSAEAFLAAVKPAVAVISVGQNNRYGHPAKEVLEKLSKLGVKIFRTDEKGDVEVVSDGEKMWVR